MQTHNILIKWNLNLYFVKSTVNFEYLMILSKKLVITIIEYQSFAYVIITILPLITCCSTQVRTVMEDDVGRQTLHHGPHYGPVIPVTS